MFSCKRFSSAFQMSPTMFYHMFISHHFHRSTNYRDQFRLSKVEIRLRVGFATGSAIDIGFNASMSEKLLVRMVPTSSRISVACRWVSLLDLLLDSGWMSCGNDWLISECFCSGGLIL